MQSDVRSWSYGLSTWPGIPEKALEAHVDLGFSCYISKYVVCKIGIF